jgi:hypothetical protein
MLYLSSPFRAEDYENRPELSSPSKQQVFAGAFGSSPAASQGSSELNTSQSHDDSPMKSTPGSWVSYGNSPPALLETPERSEEKKLNLHRRLRRFGQDHETLITAELSTYNQSGLTHFHIGHTESVIDPLPAFDPTSSPFRRPLQRANTIAPVSTAIDKSPAAGVRRRPAPIL